MIAPVMRDTDVCTEEYIEEETVLDSDIIKDPFLFWKVVVE